MLQFQPKPLFEGRMGKLLENEKDYQKFLEYARKETINSMRVNTIKISINDLKSRLEKKGWKISQPFKNFPEAMIINSELLPGEFGKATEHLLGYYYIQEISSMLPIIALQPKPNELFLDLCASPGSKTTQASALMENKGTIIANDKTIERIVILSSNLDRCGCTNVLVAKEDGVQLCEKFKKLNMKFDKILVDAPCSGEGTLRSSPKTFLMWNLKIIKKFSRTQKKLAESALSVLKEGGEMIYSTCTHSPEENEEVIDYLFGKYNNIKVEKINLDLKTRPGLTRWENKRFNTEIKNACRIYPQDNDTEGFFLCKIKKSF